MRTAQSIENPCLESSTSLSRRHPSNVFGDAKATEICVSLCGVLGAVKNSGIAVSGDTLAAVRGNAAVPYHQLIDSNHLSNLQRRSCWN